MSDELQNFSGIKSISWVFFYQKSINLWANLRDLLHRAIVSSEKYKFAQVLALVYLESYFSYDESFCLMFASNAIIVLPEQAFLLRYPSSSSFIALLTSSSKTSEQP